MNDSTLEDDIIWVYHKLDSIKSQGDVEGVEDAPSLGAKALLGYAYKYQKDFFTKHLDKALKRREQESSLRDDYRRTFDIFDQIDEQLADEWTAKRKCPFCLQSLKKSAVLLPRPERDRKESRLPEEAAGSGNEE